MSELVPSWKTPGEGLIIKKSKKAAIKVVTIAIRTDLQAKVKRSQRKDYCNYLFMSGV